MAPYCFHGWGFPSEIFEEFAGFDRGYFGEKKEGKVSSFIVTHSFGLHFVPEEAWKQCQKLVILSGFIRLREKGKIRAMREKLKREPKSLLQAFYQEAGYNGKAPWLENQIHLDLLDEDLGRMEEEVDLTEVSKIDDITLFHANGDTIVQEERGLKLQKELPQAKWVTMPGGHMSTLTKWIEQERLKKPLVK